MSVRNAGFFLLPFGVSGTVDDEMAVLMVDESTEELLTRAVAGDRVAFGRLAERFSERLSRLVGSRVGPAVREDLDVDDVVQETFRLALESIESFESRGDDSFIRWLGHIAENVIRKAARTTARKPSTEEILEIADRTTTPPSANLRRDERFDRLQSALESLPPDYRQVIRLSRIEGLKTEEIAERMGRSTSAVKQLLFRALRRLRDTFGDTESLHLPDRKFDSEN